ncbi:hypothetical protein Tco_1226560 [Tanacetum coccineum]
MPLYRKLQDTSIVKAKLSSRGSTSVASMYQTLSYVPKLSSRVSADWLLFASEGTSYSLPPEGTSYSLSPEGTSYSLPSDGTSYSLPLERTSYSLPPEETLLLSYCLWT